jgi:hypothetical protein
MPERRKEDRPGYKRPKTAKERFDQTALGGDVYDIGSTLAAPSSAAAAAKALAYAAKIAKMAKGEAGLNKVINKDANSSKSDKSRSQPVSHSVFDIDVASLIPSAMPRAPPRNSDAPVRPQNPPRPPVIAAPKPPPPQDSDQSGGAAAHHGK